MEDNEYYVKKDIYMKYRITYERNMQQWKKHVSIYVKCRKGINSKRK